MPVRYPGGTILRNQLSSGGVNQMVADIVSSLEAAGWDIASEEKAFVILTFTGVPGPSENCAFDGVTYRFRGSLTNPYDVLVGSTAYECALNLMHAILATPSEAGVRFHAGTPQHPTLTASIPSGSNLKVQWAATGLGNGFPAAEWLSNATLDSSVGRGGGNTLASERTPHGLRMRLKVQGEGSYVGLIPGSQNVWAQNPQLLTPDTGMYIIACRYQYCVYEQGGLPPYSFAIGGAPFIRAGNVGPAIAGASENDGRFEVSTLAPHGYQTGQFVNIAGAEGAPDMNGNWEIEVTGPQSFILLGSSYSAGYDGGSARAAGPGQISDCVFAQCNMNSTGATSFRNRLWIDTQGRWFSVINQHVVNFDGGWMHSYFGQLVPSYSPWGKSAWFGGAVDVLPARIGWQHVVNGVRYWVGDLWAAFLGAAPAPLDHEIQFDGRTWVNITQDADNSLWLAVS
jgi:hypothetical protein